MNERAEYKEFFFIGYLSRNLKLSGVLHIFLLVASPFATFCFQGFMWAPRLVLGCSENTLFLITFISYFKAKDVISYHKATGLDSLVTPLGIAR